MNNLQHIRSMAEMILKQLDELEGKQSPDKFFKEMETWTSGISIPGNVAKPKFKIGDRVIKTTGTSDVLVIKEIHPYPDGTGWNCILNAGCQNEDHLTLYISDEQANEVWFGPKAGERIWHSGPPPHVGWWNASFDFVKGNNDWRWWDGKCWSIVVDRFSSDNMISMCATAKVDGHYAKRIQWTDYWPENARVPRIDTRVGKPDHGHFARKVNGVVLDYWCWDSVTGDVTKV